LLSDRIKLSFTHIGKGLLAKGEELNGFTITENGKDFIKAKAIIKKKNVIVSADGITKPIAVRYAFINNADGNLFNKEGLPATPFRTDIPLN
jgi:sialate O-acetylesterase